MLTKDKTTEIRSIIFRHLDGVAIASTLVSLNKNGIIDYIRQNKNFDTAMILKRFTLNIGYLNVALRLICSQGLLIQTIIIDGENIKYSITEKGAFIFQHLKKYYFCLDWFKYFLKINPNKTNSIDHSIIKDLFIEASNNWGLDKKSIHPSYNYYLSKQLNGILISPIIALLGYNQIFNDKTTLKNFFLKNNFNRTLAKILSIENWITKKFDLTEEGKYVINISSAYGVTLSYLDTFIKVDDLIFKNPKVLQINTNLKKEKHVNRKMNVWGSGGAHKTYFKHIDKLIIELFNKPLEGQPLGVADMGCGNGQFLIHINDVIKNTLRGKNLNKYPLHFVGADYNNDALKVAKENLENANINCHLIKADISKPADYSEKLKYASNLDLFNFLNIRSFLDHNRIFSTPKNLSHHTSNSTCTFSSKGKWIPNYILENNLIEHFERWKPYISKFGLILLELHSLNPNLVKENLGKSLATAYDATHSYSDQYILELDRFKYCIKKARLNFSTSSLKFPNNKLATISINYVK